MEDASRTTDPEGGVRVSSERSIERERCVERVRTRELKLMHTLATKVRNQVCDRPCSAAAIASCMAVHGVCKHGHTSGQYCGSLLVPIPHAVNQTPCYRRIKFPSSIAPVTNEPPQASTELEGGSQPQAMTAVVQYMRYTYRSSGSPFRSTASIAD